jgi:hypothetical protein
MIDFAKLAQGTTIATDDALPTSSTIGRKKEADPALVQLVTDAASDGKRRDLPGRFSTTPYPGKKNANESQTVVGELHRAARAVGVKLNVRRFDATDKGVRLTFKVAKDAK